jgi:hypothetical protein
MSAAIDITGKRIGRLIAIYPTGKRTRSGSIIWVVRCDCGNEKEVDGHSLMRKNRPQRSCGCKRGDFKTGHIPLHRKRPVGVDEHEFKLSEQRKSRRELSDSAVRGMLNHHLGLKSSEVSPKMIAMKREQIQMYRLIQNGKELINESANNGVKRTKANVKELSRRYA